MTLFSHFRKTNYESPFTSLLPIYSLSSNTVEYRTANIYMTNPTFSWFGLEIVEYIVDLRNVDLRGSPLAPTSVHIGAHCDNHSPCLQRAHSTIIWHEDFDNQTHDTPSAGYALAIHKL